VVFSSFLRSSFSSGKGKSTFNKVVLAAWHSGHSNLRNNRPGFESRQGIRFLGKT
jgi:hypothetical protein